jgi:Ca2+-binding EF-hand superfamily protein
VKFLTESGTLEPPGFEEFSSFKFFNIIIFIIIINFIKFIIGGMHTVVRSLFRRLTFATSPDGSDLKWPRIIEFHKRMSKSIGSAEIAKILSASANADELYLKNFNITDEQKRNQVREAIEFAKELALDLNPEHTDLQQKENKEQVMVINMDYLLQLIMEGLFTRLNIIEQSLAKIFKEGDDNGDGVLSFKEFTSIVSRVAPHFHTRRILKMFREALQLGNDDDSIGPDSFVTICKSCSLVTIRYI